jgi:ribonuclease P protein component
MRVRRLGKSFAHPLLVLYVLPGSQVYTRVGVAASHAVGGAVQRNRAKRRLRACMHAALPQVAPGWDLVLLARHATLDTPYPDLRAALNNLLTRANLLVAERAE